MLHDHGLELSESRSAYLQRRFRLGYQREGYKWSKDNQKEIDSGVIIKADTVEELAKKLGIATRQCSLQQ